MYHPADYISLELARLDAQRMTRELEQRRMIAERQAELAAAEQGVTDAARSPRGIRALLPKRLRPLAPPRPATA